MGVLAGVPNFALQTNLKILWREWRNNCKGQSCEDEVSVLAGGGWRMNKTALSLYMSAALTSGSDINMTDLTTETSPLLASPQSPPAPLPKAFCISGEPPPRPVYSLSNPHLPDTKPPPPPPPTPSIPISLVLNGPCVPLILRRVWGCSQPPIPLNGFFLNVHTVWPTALYSNCVNKASDGEGHRGHADSIASKIVQYVLNHEGRQASGEMPIVQGEWNQLLLSFHVHNSKAVMDFFVSFY